MYTHITTFNRYYILDRLSFILLPILRFIVNYTLEHYQENDEFDFEAPDILSYYIPTRKLFGNVSYNAYIQSSETNGTFVGFNIYITKNPNQFGIAFNADFGPAQKELRYIALELCNTKRVSPEEAEAHFTTLMNNFLTWDYDEPEDLTSEFEWDSSAYLDKLIEENDLAQNINF